MPVKAPAEKVLKDNRREARRYHSAEDKVYIVVAGLRRPKLPEAAMFIEEHVGETLTYYDLKIGSWRFAIVWTI